MTDNVKFAIEWLEHLKRDEMKTFGNMPPDSMGARASKCIIKYYDLAINALKKEDNNGDKG